MVGGWRSRVGMRGPLWSDGGFMRLWGGQTISLFGSQITQLALPLIAILSLKASTFAVAALTVVEFVPHILFALPAGAWLDRIRRRPVMIAADWGRALALGSVPAAYFAGALTLAQLYVVGFLTGALTVFFDVAYQAYFPSLVPRSELNDGNAKLEISNSSAQIAGPGAAGLLVGALGAPYAVAADAASFVISALFIGTIRGKEPDPPASAPSARLMSEIREGIQFVLQHPLVRPNLVFMALANFFNFLFFSVLLVFAVRQLHLSPQTIGLILSIGNLGGLAAAITVGRLQRRLGIGQTMVFAGLTGFTLLLLPLASGPTRIPFLVLGIAGWGYGLVLYNVTGRSMLQAVTPSRLLGRMASARRVVAWIGIPIGGLLGGVLGSSLGLREAILIGTAGRALSGLVLLRSPLRRVRDLDHAKALAEAANVRFGGAAVAEPAP